MKRKLDKRLSLGIALIIVVVFSLSYLFVMNNGQYESKVVINGFASIGNIKEKEIIKLDGTWEFYPNELIDPDEDFSLYDDSKIYVNVPRQKNNNNIDSNYSYGTYRTKVNINDDLYGLKLRIIKSAYRVFANGDEILSLGQVGSDEKTHVKDSRYQLGIISSKNDEIELVLHLSNFERQKGGIFSSVELGQAENMVSIDKNHSLIEFMFSINLITLGIYFFFLYINRKDAKFLKYYSFMSISAAFILFLLNEQVLRSILGFNYTMRTNLQNISLSSFILNLFLFVASLYPKYVRREVKQFVILTVCGGILLYLFSEGIFGFSLPIIIMFLYSSGIIFIVFYILKILYKATKNKARGYVVTVFLIFNLTLAFLIMVAKTLLIIDLGYIQHILFTISNLSAMYLVSVNYRYDYEYALDLSKSVEITEMNNSAFMNSLSRNVLKPLKSRVKDFDDILINDSSQMSSESVERFRFVRNQTQEVVYLLDNITKAFYTDATHEYHLEVSNFKDLIEESLERITVSMNLGPVRIVNKFNFDAYVNVDENNIKNALYHIVRNSLDNISNVGVIQIDGEIVGDMVFIYIDDDGVGIAPEHLPHIFDRFYKVNSNNEERFGLGLPITKNIIENHFGTINIQSTPHYGTRVMISLPLLTSEVDVYDHDETLELSIVKQDLNFNVMVVSQDEIMINYLKKSYKNLYIFAYQRHDSEKLAENVLKNSIDVLVLDYNHVQLVKDQTAKYIRKYTDMLNTPILMVAPQQVILDLWFQHQINVNDFIESPVDYRNFILKINNLYKSKKAIESGVEKEFRYLHSQISPHFLYNTLNTIIGLSYVDSEKAREGLLNISVYLRAKLDVFNAEIFVPIEEELEVIRSYLEIENLRYEDKVKTSIEVDDNLNFKVPPLMIQNVVENSFKHAFDLKETGNELKITIKLQDGMHIINIIDNGKGMDEIAIRQIYEAKTKGFGYRNTMKRLSLIQGSSINIESKLNQGTNIEIRLPEVTHD